MANPKHRFSKARRDKRRTQDRLKIPMFRLKDGSCCRSHIAYKVGDDLFYNERVLVKGLFTKKKIDAFGKNKKI